MTDDNRKTPCLSLRDWFAGQALAGILANPNHVIGEVTFGRVGTDAFRFADAMIVVRDGTAAQDKE